ncbi:MAG: hypothetical protein Q8K45_08090 [Rubrivivax sp.]|nr:hypothetical protein [Rubrivivax sp.]
MVAAAVVVPVAGRVAAVEAPVALVEALAALAALAAPAAPAAREAQAQVPAARPVQARA